MCESCAVKPENLSDETWQVLRKLHGYAEPVGRIYTVFDSGATSIRYTPGPITYKFGFTGHK